MKSKTGLALVVCLMPLLLGCVTQGRNYWMDRAHDAADIFTATVGVGGGVRAMAGPFHVGLFAGEDVAGVREGVNVGPGFSRSDDIDTLIIPAILPTDIPLKRPPLFGLSSAPCRTSDGVLFVSSVPLFALPEPYREATVPPQRGRGHEEPPDGFVPYGNFISMVYGDQHALQYLTQIEVVAGAGGTLRLGANPGELVDFLMGFVGLDLYADDGRRPVPPKPEARPAPEERREQEPEE